MRIGYLTENLTDSSSTFIRRHIDAFIKEITFIATLHKEVDTYKKIPVYHLLNQTSLSEFSRILKFIEKILPKRYGFVTDRICQKELDYILSKYDLDCAIIQFGWMSARSYKVLIKRKIPYIIIMHGEDILSATKRLNHPYTKHIIESINFSYKTFFVSKFLFNKALIFKCNKNKMELFYLGVPIPDVRLNTNNADNIIRIINVGRLVPIKGQMIIFKTAKSLIEKKYKLKFIIIGDGPLRKSYEEWINNNNLMEYIELKGSLNYEQVIKEMSTSHIYVHSSIQMKDGTEEALGLVVLEAMSVMLPVVSSRSGGIVETVDDNTGILVDENNSEQMSAAIEKLLIDHNLRRQMGQSGYNKVKSHFNAMKQNALLYGYLQDAVKKNRLCKKD